MKIIAEPKLTKTMCSFTRTLIFFTPFLFFNNVIAQEQIGLRLGNYAGISGVSLNPTMGINNPLGWDVNIVSAGSFLANNFAFIQNASVSSTLRNVATIGPAPETKIEYPIKATKYFDFYNRPQEKYLSTTAFVSLPSVQFNLASGHSFGVFLNQRIGVSTRQIPVIADPYEQQKMVLGTLYKVPPLRIMGMTWGELGLNYAYQNGNDTEGGLSFGINVKVLRANQGIFFENLEGTAFTRLTKDSTRLDAVNVRAGFTDNFSDKPLSNNGLSLGIDLGAQFVLGSGESDERPYLFRVGVSLLDVGRVNFRKNGQIHAVKLTEPLKVDTKDFQNLDPTDPVNDALKRFNQKVYGKSDSTLQGNYFAVNLPTAFSLQADVAIIENVFVSGLLIQRVPMSRYGLSRDNVLAVAPRYESRWWSASLPLSILNYQKVRLGFALRLTFLTLGTDDMGSILGQKKFNGTDFYLALKINPFRAGKMGENGGFGSGNRTGNSAKCYRF
jgi:hypothetical protein